MKYAQVIEKLTANLLPVKPVPRPHVSFLIWAAVSYPMIVLEFLFSGDLRRFWYKELLVSNVFLIEFLLAFLASPLAALTAFRHAIPSQENLHAKDRWVPIVFVILLVGLLILGLFKPALPPSMMGMRRYCLIQTFVFALLPMAVFFILMRSYAPFQVGWVSLLIGVASVTPVTALMHIGCVYDPAHILLLHVLPIFVLSGLGIVFGQQFFRLRRF